MAECRRCLLPGMSRSCCNEYYCDKCYYENTMCANCGQQVADAADQDRDQLGRLVHMSDSNAAQQLCAWALKGSVVLLVLVVPWLLLGLDAVLGVPTMHGYRCQGPFSGGCNKELCRLMYREVNGSLREVVRAGGAVGMVGVVGVNSSTVGGSAVNGSAGATSLVSAAAAAPMLHQVRREERAVFVPCAIGSTLPLAAASTCSPNSHNPHHPRWQRCPPVPPLSLFCPPSFCSAPLLRSTLPSASQHAPLPTICSHCSRFLTLLSPFSLRFAPRQTRCTTPRLHARTSGRARRSYRCSARTRNISACAAWPALSTPMVGY